MARKRPVRLGNSPAANKPELAQVEEFLASTEQKVEGEYKVRSKPAKKTETSVINAGPPPDDHEKTRVSGRVSEHAATTVKSAKTSLVKVLVPTLITERDKIKQLEDRYGLTFEYIHKEVRTRAKASLIRRLKSGDLESQKGIAARIVSRKKSETALTTEMGFTFQSDWGNVARAVLKNDPLKSVALSRILGALVAAEFPEKVQEVEAELKNADTERK